MSEKYNATSWITLAIYISIAIIPIIYGVIMWKLDSNKIYKRLGLALIFILILAIIASIISAVFTNTSDDEDTVENIDTISYQVSLALCAIAFLITIISVALAYIPSTTYGMENRNTWLSDKLPYNVTEEGKDGKLKIFWDYVSPLTQESFNVYTWKTWGIVIAILQLIQIYIYTTLKPVKK